MGRARRSIRVLAAVAALGAAALLGGCYVAPPYAGYGYYGDPAYAYSAPVQNYAAPRPVTAQVATDRLSGIDSLLQQPAVQASVAAPSSTWPAVCP